MNPIEDPYVVKYGALVLNHKPSILNSKLTLFLYEFLVNFSLSIEFSKEQLLRSKPSIDHQAFDL
jgi:hypothetical protein